jgi:hypothetical protein
MSKLALIKTAVAILTFLLIFGLLSVVGLLFSKTKSSKNISFQEISLNEPVDSTIYGSEYDDKFIYITIKGGGLSDRIIIFDHKSGQQVSKIKLN